MNDLAPNIKELNEAELVIESVYAALRQMNGYLDQLADMGPREVLAPAATHYKNLNDLENAIEEARLRVYHFKEGYQFHVLPPLFRDASVDTVKTLNGYTMKMSDEMSVSIPVDKKPKAYEWLQENGYADIIQSTVNSSTLRATVKSMMKDGVVVPEDVFKIGLFNRFKLTKSSYGMS